MKRLWVATIVAGFLSTATAAEDIRYTYDARGQLRHAEGQQGMSRWLTDYRMDAADNRRELETYREIRMVRGQRLSAPSGVVHLDFQSDGNLCLYRDGRSGSLWCVIGSDKDARTAAFQMDGNFVVYNGSGGSVWASDTSGNYHARLAVQDDGNLVIYRSDGSSAWATMTNGL